MNRRDLVAESFRYLAQALPAIVVAAGSLGAFFRQPVTAAIDQEAGCFPAQAAEKVPSPPTHLPEENKR
jgi:hypothetical protein